MSEILRSLNEEQKAAVTCIQGPMLIVAGAGSGKTRVLTSRIAFLIQNGILPERILALTFTKKAAGEMKERVERLTGGSGVFVSTFHAACVRILRGDADRLGYTRNFTIYDTADSQSLAKKIIKEMEKYDVKEDELDE